MEIESFLSTQVIGHNFIFFESIDSTNRIAHDLAEQGIPEGCVICADHQSSGHGRQGRIWFSPAERNLYFSVILAPTQPASQVVQLSLVAGLAIATVLQRYLSNDKKVYVKWPNDIWINNKKCCGILCEIINASQPNKLRLIIGIGVNINLSRREIPSELQNISTSLFAEIDEITLLSREIILSQFLKELETRYFLWQKHGLAYFLEEWEQFSILKKKIIKANLLDKEIIGQVIGLSPQGNLRIKLETEEILDVSAGDIHILSIE